MQFDLVQKRYLTLSLWPPLKTNWENVKTSPSGWSVLVIILTLFSPGHDFTRGTTSAIEITCKIPEELLLSNWQVVLLLVGAERAKQAPRSTSILRPDFADLGKIILKVISDHIKFIFSKKNLKSDQDFFYLDFLSLKVKKWSKFQKGQNNLYVGAILRREQQHF
jgi:hypothetical protein